MSFLLYTLKYTFYENANGYTFLFDVNLVGGLLGRNNKKEVPSESKYIFNSIFFYLNFEKLQ